MLDSAGSKAGFGTQSAERPAELRESGALAWCGVGATLALLLAAAALGGLGLDRHGIEFGLRLTARLAFVFFWPCYVAGSLVALFGPWFAPLKRRARVLGLAFAAVLAVHLGLVAALCAIGAAPSARVFLTFGVGAFCATLLATASIGWVGAAIGPAGWWWLRHAAMNYLLLDFAIDFYRQGLPATPYRLVLYAPFALLTAVAPMLRIAAWLKAREIRWHGAPG